MTSHSFLNPSFKNEPSVSLEIMYRYINMVSFDGGIRVSWCSWLSRQSNTLKVSGSSPGDAIVFFFFPFNYVIKLLTTRASKEMKSSKKAASFLLLHIIFSSECS